MTVHYRRPPIDGVPQPVECGDSPIPGADSSDKTTSERDAATCEPCRRIALLADAAAMAHGCNRGDEHRGVARGRYYGGEDAHVKPANGNQP